MSSFVDGDHNGQPVGLGRSERIIPVDTAKDMLESFFTDTVKKFNRIINAHKTEIIISSSKNLKDVT